MTWLRRLVTPLWPRRQGFNRRLVCMGFVMDKATLWRVSPEYFRLYLGVLFHRLPTPVLSLTTSTVLSYHLTTSLETHLKERIFVSIWVLLLRAFVRPKIVYAQQCLFKNPMPNIKNPCISWGYGTREDMWRERHIIFTVDLVRLRRDYKRLAITFF